jgi:hypothetical protein
MASTTFFDQYTSTGGNVPVVEVTIIENLPHKWQLPEQLGR